jgi:small subunit ribosomal protein S18
MARPAPRGKGRESTRRIKKKVSILNTEGVQYIDYKDVNLLRRFMSDRAKIRARRVTGNDTQQQADIAMAIKNAREMALLPYTSRVTQQRGGRRGERGDRGDRGDRPERDRDRSEAAAGGPPPLAEEATETEVVVDETVLDADGGVEEVVETVEVIGDGGADQ